MMKRALSLITALMLLVSYAGSFALAQEAPEGKVLVRFVDKQGEVLGVCYTAVGEKATPPKMELDTDRFYVRWTPKDLTVYAACEFVGEILPIEQAVEEEPAQPEAPAASAEEAPAQQEVTAEEQPEEPAAPAEEVSAGEPPEAPAAPAEEVTAEEQPEQPAAPAEEASVEEQPEEPAAPAEEVTAGEQPEQPAAPAEEVTAGEQPEAPAAPAEEAPAQQEVTAEEQPEEPAAPAQQEVTAEEQPEQPATPAEEAPAQQEAPAEEQPEAPAAEEQPEAPAAEEQPEAPAAEEQPEAPVAEEQPEAPAQQEQPGQSPSVPTEDPEVSIHETMGVLSQASSEQQPAAPAEAPAEQLAADTFVVQADIDIREQADGLSPIFVTVPAGTVLPVLGSEGDWLKVSFQGAIGYIYAPVQHGGNEQPGETEDDVEKKVVIFSSRRSQMAEGEPVTLSCLLEGFDGYEIRYQWECDDGTGYADVPGANSETHVFQATAETLSFGWRLRVLYR